jgi:hypothetical protein
VSQTIASNEDKLILSGDVMNYDFWVRSHYLMLWRKVGMSLEAKIAN